MITFFQTVDSHQANAEPSHKGKWEACISDAVLNFCIHGIMQWVGLEGTLNIIHFNPRS